MTIRASFPSVQESCFFFPLSLHLPKCLLSCSEACAFCWQVTTTLPLIGAGGLVTKGAGRHACLSLTGLSQSTSSHLPIIRPTCSAMEIQEFLRSMFFAETRSLWHLRHRVWPWSWGIRAAAKGRRAQKEGDRPRCHTARPRRGKCQTAGYKKKKKSFQHHKFICAVLKVFVFFVTGRPGHSLHDGTADEAQKDRNHRLAMFAVESPSASTLALMLLSRPLMFCFFLQISSERRSTRWWTATSTRVSPSWCPVCFLWTRFTCWTSSASRISIGRWRAPSPPSLCSPPTGETASSGGLLRHKIVLGLFGGGGGGVQ